MRLAPVIATVSLLVACTTSPPPIAPYVYACEDGSVLTVRFVPDAAYVTAVGGQELYLPQFASGSGFWYGTAQYELRGKGDEVTWTVARRVPTSCSVRR